MSLQPRTAAPGKARRAASAGKPRTKKNAAKSTKSTFNPIDKEVQTESRSVKKTAPKTTRRYSDGPKGTATRKEERNLERSKLRAKRYQEKIAPKAKTTSRADEFVAKRTERAERPERAEKTERTFKKTEYRSGEYKKTTFKKTESVSSSKASKWLTNFLRLKTLTSTSSQIKQICSKNNLSKFKCLKCKNYNQKIKNLQ